MWAELYWARVSQIEHKRKREYYFFSELSDHNKGGRQGFAA